MSALKQAGMAASWWIGGSIALGIAFGLLIARREIRRRIHSYNRNGKDHG